MSSGELTRGSKNEPSSGRDRHRDHHVPNGNSAGPSGNSQPHPDSASNLGSLHSRIGGKEAPRSLPPISSYRPESQRKEDDRESRKRTASGKVTCFLLYPFVNISSDRDQDMNEPPPGPGSELSQVPKRPRINRNRYNANTNAPNQHALARKLLPIDPTAGDKSRGRKD